MSKSESFTSVVASILDVSKPIPARILHRLSDLDPVDLQSLLNVWPGIPEKRKINLLEDLEILAETDNLACFENLAFALLADQEPKVRVAAIHLLWEYEDAKLADMYLSMLQVERDTQVRAAIVNALGHFVYLGEVDKLPGELARKTTSTLLALESGDAEDLICRRALESLGYSSMDEMAPVIEKAYHSDSKAWKISAICAMGRSADEKWKTQVISQLRTPDEEIRSEAIHAAGELELKPAVPLLLDILEDEDDLEMRHEIIWALSRTGGEGVRARLEELLETEEDDEEEEFIEEALETLAFTEDMDGFSLLDVNEDVDFIEEEPDKN